MNVDNVALLYLLHQDISALSLEELIVHYNDTVKEVKERVQELGKDKGDTYSFS